MTETERADLNYAKYKEVRAENIQLRTLAVLAWAFVDARKRADKVTKQVWFEEFEALEKQLQETPWR